MANEEVTREEIEALKAALKTIENHELRDHEDYEAIKDIATYALAASQSRPTKGADPSASGQGMVARCLKTGNPFGTDTWQAGHPCDCAVCRAMLALAPAPSPDDGDWLPIESAPKDGTRYLFAARYPDEWRYAVARWKDCRWFSGSVEGRITYLTSKATHWRPLPPPPAQTTEGKP